jgi:glutamate racemase
MVKDSDRPIGVFDSGVGGLTVAAAIRRFLPAEPIVYFGDLLHLPYGSKSSRAVLDFTRAAVKFLLDRSVKLIVIACNTATSIAGQIIEGEVDVPVIGVIDPGAEAACRMTRNGHIGVIGTKRTIESNAYGDAIRKFNPHARVCQVATPLLVPLIEEGWQSHPVTRMVLDEYLGDFRESEVDTIVLGCTHYPLIRSEIQDLLGDVVVVDSAETTAREIVETLGYGEAEPVRRRPEDRGRLEPAGGYHVYLTDYTDVFRSMGENILGRKLDDLHIIDLDWAEGRINYSVIPETTR